MDLEVTLAGHRAPWWYRGSRALREWLESQPWLRGGGGIVLHIGTTGDPDLVLESVRRGVRAADDAGFTPEVRVVSIDEALLENLKLEFCGARDAPERQLVDECAYRPRLIIVMTATGGGGVLRDAIAFSDRARKLAPDFRAGFLFVSTARCADEGALDLLVGSPDDHVLRLVDDTQDRLFRAYLHARIAWESAGSLRHARALDAALGSYRVGDDEAVETWLNRYALATYAEAPAADRRLLVALLDAVVHNAARELRRLALEARDTGFLWSPFGRERLRTVPWVARALLATDRFHPAAPLLRSHVTCAPFARELLGRCLELEARERTKLSWALGTAPAPADAIARHAAFERDEVGSDSAYYPRCSPARPTDAWAFVEFGAFIDAAVRAGTPDLPRRDLHALRQLRNALAHGHYASWSTLRRLLEIERRLGITF